MRISIVIPTYNRPHFLALCLAALDGQAFRDRDTEIHVVDDGSQLHAADANRTLCVSHHAHYHRLLANHGMAVARNEGIRHSTGSWLVCIDDDFRVAEGWLTTLRKTLAAQPETVAGVEGRIDAEGNGLWDREVQNRQGGLYLTCHIAYRKVVIDQINGFDPVFEFKGPFCEDHEIAARVLRHGSIAFAPELCGVHLPRRIRLLSYVAHSFKRVRQLLAAEQYFFSRQGEWYHRFRHAHTFWGTYASILFRNLLNNLRRRKIADLIRHPLEALVLVAASLIEQAGAWLLLPGYIGRLLKNQPDWFYTLVDATRTATLWNMLDAGSVYLLRLGRAPLYSLVFPFIKHPVYDVRPLLRRIAPLCTRSDCRLLLRIDDVFCREDDAAERFCALMEEKKYPFLAGVTGNDLLRAQNGLVIDRLRNAGAEIAIHGFNHEGRFGPYQSELLQITYPDLLRRLASLAQAPVFKNCPPRAFMPPFNAISGDQISFLAQHFAIVTGGPETLRFSDQAAGPLAMKNGGWYVPATYPYYNTAARMLKRRYLEQLAGYGGIVCLTLHMTEEAKTGFKNLRRLLNNLPSKPVSWQIFTKGNSGTSYF